MNIGKFLFTITASLIIVNSARAQVDPHFSQYYSNPLWLNPALTGAVDGEYRATLSFKDQWRSVGNGYTTGGISFDKAPVKNLAFGAMIIHQSAGDVDYNYMNVLASASYRLKFGNDGLDIISFGLQGGFINRSFDASKITLGSQFNPITGYDPTMPFDETFQSSSTIVPDVNAGIMYFDANPDQKVNAFGGFSAAHINRPHDKFISQNAYIPIRYTAHGGARVKISELVAITPHVLYMTQNTTREIAAGAYAQLMLQSDSNLLFGSSYRFEDSANAFLGLQLKNLLFGVSYDVNTSPLQRSSQSRGGLEFSISFTRRSGITGPNFYCPRL